MVCRPKCLPDLLHWLTRLPEHLALQAFRDIQHDVVSTTIQRQTHREILLKIWALCGIVCGFSCNNECVDEVSAFLRD